MILLSKYDFKRIHPAPTIMVLPGGFCKLKISSLLMPYSSAPGTSGYFGLPPTAIKKCLAVKVLSPLGVTVCTVLTSLNVPKPLIYSTFLKIINCWKLFQCFYLKTYLSLNSTLVTQFTDLMWFWTAVFNVSQSWEMFLASGKFQP